MEDVTKARLVEVADNLLKAHLSILTEKFSTPSFASAIIKRPP
jgi:hypothetical protein